MHYLECNSCGHLNEVKTEYLTFCTACNKKLEDNFSSWKIKNPNKSFIDFTNLVCVTKADIQSDSKLGKKKSKSLKYWIGFIIGMLIFSAVGKYGGEMIVKYLNSEMTSEIVFEKEWIRKNYGDYGLTVETPATLTKSDLPIPEVVKQVIDKMDVYEYSSEKGFKVIINSIKYNAEIGSVNLQGGADGSVNEMRNQEGVTDFKYTEEKVFKNDIPGFIQNGTFKSGGVEIEFVNTGFGEGLVFWQVIVIFQSNDAVGRKAARRVIKTIEIKKKPKRA